MKIKCPKKLIEVALPLDEISANAPLLKKHDSLSRRKRWHERGLERERNNHGQDVYDKGV